MTFNPRIHFVTIEMIPNDYNFTEGSM